jgi:DNA primase
MPTASTPDVRPILSLADLEAFDPPRGRDPEKVCRCPICRSSERAFHLNTATGVYNCKRASCGAKGKLFDFWQERPKQSARQHAQSRLNAAFSLAPKDCSPKAPNAPHSAPQREQSAQASEPATAATWQTLFAQSKPISGTEAAAYLARRGIPESLIEASGARVLRLYPGGYRREYALFPFCDRDGQTVAFLARAIDGAPDGHRAHGPRSAGVFSTGADALKAESVILCEAPIDALSLAACGYPAIALGGVTAPDWLPAALAFKRVYLALDNDQNGAGDKAASEIAPELESFGARVLRLAPPREEGASKSDWNALLLRDGAAALGDWLCERVSVSEPAENGNNFHFEAAPLAETKPNESEAREYSQPAPTGKDTPCVSCGAYCGTAALCAFCE